MLRITLKHIFIILLSVFISLPPFTSQILPTIASYHQTAVKNENLKNKKVSYKEIRQRKHSKNKPNLKNQTALSCQKGQVVTKPELLLPPRAAAPAVWSTVNNKAYIFTGYNLLSGYPSGRLNSIVEYDPASGAVATKTATITARHNASAAWDSVHNKAYIFGGDPGYCCSYNQNQIFEYDPITDIAINKSESLPNQLYGTAAAWNSNNNKVYIIGGGGSGLFATIVEYDPATGTVTTKSGALPSARRYPTAVFYPPNNKIYIFGGSEGSNALNQIVEYNPGTDTVVLRAETLPTGVSGASAIFNPVNNKIYVYGGGNQVVEYDPIAATVVTRSETLPGNAGNSGVVFDPVNNRTYVLGGWGTYNQIVEHTVTCNPPSNPIISSVTLNNLPQTVASSYRITNGQTLIVNLSATDTYPGNQVTLSCDPPAGKFSHIDGTSATGRIEFTPDASNIGTYNYTVTATSNSGTAAASTLTFSVSVNCGNDAGCPSGQICVQSICCAPCPYRSSICDDRGTTMICSAALIPTAPPPPLVTSVQTPIPQLTSSPAPLVPSSPTPSPTATPATNVTNSGTTTTSQGAIISQPTVSSPQPAPSNTAPQAQPNIFTPEQVKAINTFVQSTMVIDIGLIQKNMPVDKAPAVKSDSASYIDVSKQK